MADETKVKTNNRLKCERCFWFVRKGQSNAHIFHIIISFLQSDHLTDRETQSFYKNTLNTKGSSWKSKLKRRLKLPLLQKLTDTVTPINQCTNAYRWGVMFDLRMYKNTLNKGSSWKSKLKRRLKLPLLQKLTDTVTPNQCTNAYCWGVMFDLRMYKNTLNKGLSWKSKLKRRLKLRYFKDGDIDPNSVSVQKRRVPLMGDFCCLLSAQSSPLGCSYSSSAAMTRRLIHKYWAETVLVWKLFSCIHTWRHIMQCVPRLGSCTPTSEGLMWRWWVFCQLMCA